MSWPMGPTFAESAHRPAVNVGLRCRSMAFPRATGHHLRHQYLYCSTKDLLHSDIELFYQAQGPSDG